MNLTEESLIKENLIKDNLGLFEELPAVQKANILLVDDHPENLLAMEAVLASQGYNLISVTSGTEALKQLMKENIAAIILDAQMPDLDGFETAR